MTNTPATTNNTADVPQRRFLTVPAPYVSRSYITSPIPIPHEFKEGFSEADLAASMADTWPRLIEAEKELMKHQRQFRRDLGTPEGRLFARVIKEVFGRTPANDAP